MRMWPKFALLPPDVVHTLVHLQGFKWFCWVVIDYQIWHPHLFVIRHVPGTFSLSDVSLTNHCYPNIPRGYILSLSYHDWFLGIIFPRFPSFLIHASKITRNSNINVLTESKTLDVFFFLFITRHTSCCCCRQLELITKFPLLVEIIGGKKLSGSSPFSC